MCSKIGERGRDVRGRVPLRCMHLAKSHSWRRVAEAAMMEGVWRQW